MVIGRQLGHLSSSLCSISVATRAWAYLASLNRLSGILRRSHWREAQRTERLRFKRSYDTQGTARKPPRWGGDAAEMRRIELRKGSREGLREGRDQAEIWRERRHTSSMAVSPK